MSAANSSHDPAPHGVPQELWESVPTGFRVYVLDAKDPERFSVTLAQWRERHGGDEGYVSFFNRARYPLSLAPFAHLDPAHTYIVVEQYSRPPSPQWEENAKKPPIPFTPAMMYAYSLLPDNVRTPPIPMGKHRGTVRVLPPALVYAIGPNGGVNETPPADAATLAAYRDALGGDVGIIVDRYLGQTHPLSFATYRHMDPETTYLSVRVEFTPEGHAAAVEQWRKHDFDPAHVPPPVAQTSDADSEQTKEGDAA